MSLVINPAKSRANNLEELVCTLNFKNEVASNCTSLFCLAKAWSAGVVFLSWGWRSGIFFAAPIISPAPEKCTGRELGNSKFPDMELEG